MPTQQTRNMTDKPVESVLVGPEPGEVQVAPPKIAAPPPLGWAFRYEGPAATKDDRSCELCSSVAAKKCLVGQRGGHGNTVHWQAAINKPDSGIPANAVASTDACTACYCVRVGFCPNHCGISVALAKHSEQHPIDEPLVPAFKAARDAILFVAQDAPDGATLEVFAAAQQDHPNVPFRAIDLHIVVHK